MEKVLQKHLDADLPFLRESKLLLAISGGLDSMVMSHLFQNLGYDISIAHCNFQLRGAESFADQQFIETYADLNEIRLFTTIFDTAAFAKDYKLSTQMAARELRYNWFYELAGLNKFDYILTAHHADDNLETFLINISRGTGIDGLTGIPRQNDKIIRPLLPFSRVDIEKYAKAESIQWREDSSNESDKYLRNKIRHALVPIVKDINPEIANSLSKTQHYLQQTQSMADDAAVMVYQQVAQQANDEIHFNVTKLMVLPNYRSYLYHWLIEFGFSAWDDIYNLVNGESGKQVLSHSHALLKNRDYLILSPLRDRENEEYTISKGQSDVKIPINLTIVKVDRISDASNTTIFVDADKLDFPVVLRKWREADSFYPFGMDGKSKKISKFFKDEKLSLIVKGKTWLLCSDKKIVWVVGMRSDDRFKVTPTTTNILQITLE